MKKSEYLESRYNDCIAELEEIISVGFRPYGPWITVITNNKLVSIPSFLFVQIHDQLNNPPSSAEIESKDEARHHLQTIYESCERIFIAVGDVFREGLQADYQRLKQSSCDNEEKIDRLDSLIDKGRDLIACYGVRADPATKLTNGLLYGSPVDECLYSIREYGEYLTILEDGKIHPKSYYETDQRPISLSRLQQLQKLALPVALDYLFLQIGKMDKRNKHGEKEMIKRFWESKKNNYLNNSKFHFKASDTRKYNQDQIAQAIKDDGHFKSSKHTIKDYAGLRDLP